jgi:hypothetical protein
LYSEVIGQIENLSAFSTTDIRERNSNLENGKNPEIVAVLGLSGDSGVPTKPTGGK